MEILYVTSFTSRMYSLTGVQLVRSFLHSGSDGTLLLCHEGPFSRLRPASDRVRCYDLDRSAFLAEWLAANRDIIPVSLGGVASSCACGEDEETSGHHTGCVFHWFNKNASRWFRKIVSLDFALRHVTCDAIVWVDCDCIFTNRLPASLFGRLFEDASVLYHKSPDRAVVESGVIAFRCDEGGRALLAAVIDRFRTGAFRRNVRWDDGYQFQVVIGETRYVASKDLGTRAPGVDGMGHVLPSSPLGEYIRHFKGAHAGLRLMV